MDVPVPSGVTLALGEGVPDSVGEGVGVGDVLRFFFFGDALREASGEGLGEDFFFFGEGETLGSAFSVGVGLAVAFFFGEGDFSGDAVGFGEGDFSGDALGFGEGDFWAVVFFFVFLRGAGVGVGAKIFLSLLPHDSSARVFAAPLKLIAITRRRPQKHLICPIGAGT